MTRTVLLGDIADVLNGAAFSSRDFITADRAEQGDLPVFKMGNLSIGGGLRQGKDDYIPKDKLVKLHRIITRPNDILMCMTDMKSSMNLLGYSGQIQDEVYAVNQRVGIIRPNEGLVCPRYLYYYMNSPDYIARLRATANSGVQVNLSTSAIRTSEIFLPEFKEQERVASIVGVIDEKIELNRQMNETLEQMGQALFRHYFIDNPEAEKWEEGTLNDLIDINPRDYIPRKMTAPYLEMKNMPESGMSVKGVEAREFSSGMKFRNGDTLVARITPCLENGKTAFVDFLKADEVGFGSTEYIVMRAKSDTAREYSYYLARSDGFRAYAIQSMIGTSGRQRVQNDSIKSYTIKLPHKDLLEKFHNDMLCLFAQIRNNAEQIQTLTALRDTLLPRLINGKVKV
jgi:type I restriction enzyme S subunit